MGHIRRHPVDDAKWQVRCIDPTGRERSKTFRRKVDADKYLIHVEAQKQRAEWIDPELSATRLEDWAQQWLATRTNLKPKTRAGYESLLRVRILPRFGKERLDRINPVAIQRWVADMVAEGLSASRIEQAHRVLSQILKAAVRARYLAANPAVGTSLPRKTRREQLFLEPEEIDRLAAAVGDRYRALIYVLSYGGLRWGEAAALRRRRIDVLRSRIDVTESMAQVGAKFHFGATKNYRSRTIVVSGFLCEMLNEHLVSYTAPEPDGLVFTAANGHRCETRTSAATSGSPPSPPPGCPRPCG